MPELPEVETVVRCLAPRLAGRSMLAVDVLWPGSLQDEARLLESALPTAIRGVTRRAKLIVLRLEPDIVLAVHLKMSGALLLKPRGEEPDAWTRLVFELDGPEVLHFRDVRKFGYCRALRESGLAVWPFYAQLGPEPLDTPAEVLAERLAAKRGAIKAQLLDQSVLAGVGNIYADESLFAAGVHPQAKASDLGRERLIRLCRGLQDVLARAVEGCGTSIRDYVNAEGDAGAFQNELRIYGRKGKPCPNCGQTLQGCVVAGRSTVFCPRCQR